MCFCKQKNEVMVANAQCRDDLKTNGACGKNNCNSGVGLCHDQYGKNLLFADCRIEGPNNIFLNALSDAEQLMADEMIIIIIRNK